MAAEIIPTLPGNPYGLGRQINHDERSLAYAFGVTEDARAAVVAVEWQRRVPVFDQGKLGSCTGNAMGGWLGTDNKLRQGLTTFKSPGYSGDLNEQAAVEIYHEATIIDPYQGTYPPTDTGSDGLSVTKVAKNLGYVDTYTHILAVADVKAAVQAGPVLCGTNWYQGMFTPDSTNVVSISGALAGGHEYLLVGYDADGSLNYPAPYKFTNSWGTGWADNGYFYMSEATLTQLLKSQGDATVPHAVVTSPPTGKTITQVVVTYSDGTTQTLP